MFLSPFGWDRATRDQCFRYGDHADKAKHALRRQGKRARVSTNREAQEKLSWALRHVGGSAFQAAIERKTFAEYRIAFFPPDHQARRIPKRIDIAAIDDCSPSIGHIPQALKTLLEQVKVIFWEH
jgi:hypothetical protein